MRKLLILAMAGALMGCEADSEGTIVIKTTETEGARAAVMLRGVKSVRLKEPKFRCGKEGAKPTVGTEIWYPQSGYFFEGTMRGRGAVRGAVCSGAQKPARVEIFPNG